MKSVFSKSQLGAIAGFGFVMKAILSAFAAMDMKKVGALFTVLGQLFGAFAGNHPVTPYKDSIDMSKFELVFADEFDHGFDDTIWQGHYVYGDNDTQKRDTAYWNRDQVSFTDDGCLKITVEYKEDGPAGPNYYSYGMETNPNKNYNGRHTGYEQLYGYFEISCILPKGLGINPAFWLLTDGMWADDTDGGVTGAEVDVFETDTDNKPGDTDYGSVYHTIHVDSYEDAHRAEWQGAFYANDPYNQFNTYGVEWNEEGYIFYVNGVETARTDFAGVCQVPLYLIISVGVDENIQKNTDLPASLIVDYVRAYQYVG